MATFTEKLTVFTKLYGKSFFLLIIIILFFAAAVETDVTDIPLEQEDAETVE